MGFEEGEWRYTCELACKNDLALNRLAIFEVQISGIVCH